MQLNVTIGKRYKAVNPKREQIVCPSTVSRSEAKFFSRLRLGHTIMTHQYLVLKEDKPQLQSLEHILERFTIFGHSTPNENNYRNKTTANFWKLPDRS